MAAELKKLELLKLQDPPAGEREEDWIKWRTSHLGIPVETPIHALGLHRDPNRGATHILWYGVKYTPDAGKDIGQKFTIVTAGVYEINDVLSEIEGCMGLERGEGREYIDDLLKPLNNKPEQSYFPFVSILVCHDDFRGLVSV